MTGLRTTLLALATCVTLISPAVASEEDARSTATIPRRWKCSATAC
jgi:hypothetical protein